MAANAYSVQLGVARQARLVCSAPCCRNSYLSRAAIAARLGKVIICLIESTAARLCQAWRPGYAHGPILSSSAPRISAGGAILNTTGQLLLGFPDSDIRAIADTGRDQTNRSTMDMPTAMVVTAAASRMVAAITERNGSSNHMGMYLRTRG